MHCLVTKCPPSTHAWPMHDRCYRTNNSSAIWCLNQIKVWDFQEFWKRNVLNFVRWCHDAMVVGEGGAYKPHHARYKSVKRGPQRRRRPSACEPSERFYYIYLISWIGRYYNYVELHLFLIMYKKRELRGTRDWLFLTVLTINILIPDWMILIRVDIYLNT